MSTGENERSGLPPAFSIEAGPSAEGALVLVLAGEVDVATSGEFRRHVESSYDGPPDTVVLDMAGVTFVDSTMLRELLRAHGALRERGRRLVLADLQQPVLRLLQLTGTAEVFETAGDVREALST